jgi:dolichol-phosphate mannosyltransferase
VSVVVTIPTYNERENIEKIAEAVLARPVGADLMVIDDGSPDGTADLVRGLMDKYPGRVEVLARTAKDGLGRAYIAAFTKIFSEGKYDIVQTMDADFSHDPQMIDQLVAAIEGGADVAIGSRYCAGGGVSGWSKSREVLSRGGNTYARMVLRTGLRDMTGGFRAWRTSALEKIDPASAKCDGYGFQIETAARCVAADLNIVELPITFRERAAGTSKMSSKIAIEAFRNIPVIAREIHRDKGKR